MTPRRRRIGLGRRTVPLLVCAPLVPSCDEVVDPVMSDGGFVAVAVGMTHTCGLTAAGVAYCWGSGTDGQLGTGGTSASATPRRVQLNPRLVALTAGGAHTCGLAADSTAYCWGDNRQRQAAGSADATLTATALASALRFARLSAGTTHTCGLTAEGAVYCWGANGQGQSGHPVGADLAAPRLVTAPRAFRAVSAGSFHTCALDDGGAAWCWGANTFGQLGDGTSHDSATPRPVSDGIAFLQISAGYVHTCAVDTTQQAWCWGGSEHGELGNGAHSLPGLPGAPTPRRVHQGELVASLGSGVHTSCLVRLTGVGWCWGRGTEGQTGIGARRSWPTPLPVADGYQPFTRLRFSSIGVGRTHACGLTNVGPIYCWGDGKDGQLGAGALRSSPLAVRVVAAR